MNLISISIDPNAKVEDELKFDVKMLNLSLTEEERSKVNFYTHELAATLHKAAIRKMLKIQDKAIMRKLKEEDERRKKWN